MSNSLLLCNFSLLIYFVVEKMKIKRQFSFIMSLLPLCFLVIFENGGALSKLNLNLLIPSFVFVVVMSWVYRKEVNYFNLLSLLWFSYFVGYDLSIIDIQVGVMFYFLCTLLLVEKNQEYKYILGQLSTVVIFAVIFGLTVFAFEKIKLSYEFVSGVEIYNNLLIIFFTYSLGAVGRFKLLEKMDKNIKGRSNKIIFYFLTYFALPMFLSYQVRERYVGSLTDNGYFLAMFFGVLCFSLGGEFFRIRSEAKKLVDFLLYHHLFVGCFLYFYFSSALHLWMLAMFLFALFLLKIFLSFKYNSFSINLKFFTSVFLLGSPFSPLFFIKFNLIRQLGDWDYSVIFFGMFLYLPILFLPKILDVTVVANEI